MHSILWRHREPDHQLVINESVPTCATPWNLPQLFYASILQLRCDGRARGAIYVARIEWYWFLYLKFAMIIVSSKKDNVPSHALPLNLPQLFYASISQMECILRVVGAILVAWIKWFCSRYLKFPPIEIECFYSFNTLKLARMMVPNVGNE